MKTVLILNGSPRGRNGNTGILVDKFLEGYLSVKTDAKVDYVELYKSKINGCIGCFNCWRKTPGQCFHKDDMSSLLERYISADIIVWATPLYHHGMTSILKTFVERTLPVSQPYIIKMNGKFTHPERWDMSGKKNILISNCGFPEHHNFDIISQSFDRIASDGIDESIQCVMGELLSKKPLQSVIKWYLDAVEKSGVEFAESAHISDETRQILNKPLVEVESFIEMANLSWEASDEAIPSLEEAMGHKSNVPSNRNGENLKGINQLRLMKHSFNPDKSKGLAAVLEIEFTDINESYHFLIKNESCKLVAGKAESFTTKIMTPFDVWMKISRGELDGSQAMMDGLYKVEGDMNFLIQMKYLFGGADTVTTSQKDDFSDDKIAGIHGGKWMSFLFMPWIMSWIAISHSAIWGIWVPLILATCIAGVKSKYHAVTYFEKTSTLYFCVLGISQLAGILVIGHQGVIMNYFSIALIWGISLLDHNPLTSDYSKHDVGKGLCDNVIFKKTNENLTLLWSLMFAVQGSLYILLSVSGLTKYAPCLYILTIAALRFTKWYSDWYPRKIMQG